MKKLSGLVLDHYDDADGEVLRSLFSSTAEVPDLIKHAHYVAPEELAKLPSDVFALELIDGPVVLRKFACVDPGNTALSVEYFFKTANKLPEEAQKVAAQNLVTACGWYGIEPPAQLQKVAVGLGTLATMAMAPTVIKDTKKQIDQNMATARASGGAVNPEALTFANPMLGGRGQ